MTVETVQATDFLIVVDNLDGLRAYRVTHFAIDTQRAVLRPVFDNGKTPRDFSSFATFRLVNPQTQPSWQYDAALRLVESREEKQMFGGGGKSSKVSVPKGRTQANGTVSFKSGAKPGPAGSGQARNDRLRPKPSK